MSEQMPLVFVNGLVGASVSPLDRGLAYGDGLFETLRVVAGRLPLWPLHYQRLEAGAQRLGIPLDGRTLGGYLDQALREVARNECTDGVLKIILTRGCGGKGYGLPDLCESTYCLIFHSAPDSTDSDGGLRVRVCRQRLAANPALAGIKHLNRLEQVMARAEWQNPAIAEGLLLDQSDLVIEATASNLFAVIDGRLFTPDLSQAGVAGVARRLILDRLAPGLGIPVEIVPLTLEQLQLADEIFLCNSIRGIRAVCALGEHNAPQWPVGPVTEALRVEWERVLARGLV